MLSVPLPLKSGQVRPAESEILYANTHDCKALGLMMREADRASKSEWEGAGPGMQE